MQNLVELRFRKTNRLNRKTHFPKFCTSPSAGTLGTIMKKVNIESDHIGLYPRKGEAKKKNYRPMIYIVTIPEGNDELIISEEHPLAAPIRKQLSDGSPGGSWRYLVAKKEELLNIIGSINISVGDRLIFFPSNYNITIKVNGKNKLLDHISFDLPPKMKSHYTFRDNSHQGNGDLFKISDNLTLWFTLLIVGFENYVILPNQIMLPIDWPSSDVARFSKDGVLSNYRSKSIIEIPSVIDEAKFHQIDFFIGTNDTMIEELPNIVLENYYDIDQPENVPSGIAKIDVVENVKLFVKIFEKKGVIPNDSLIMGSELIK